MSHLPARWKMLPIVLLSLAAILALPGCGPAGGCDRNLKQIAIALQNYRSDFGTYPPTWVVNNAGERMHSWRVLLLPYLGEGDLYRKYKCDEPWNGPNNRQLVRDIPSMYRCPDASLPEGVTSYFAIVGPNSMWCGDGRGISRRDVIDPEGMTIMVCESKDRSTLWIEPDDIDSESVQGVNLVGTNGISRQPQVQPPAITDNRPAQRPPWAAFRLQSVKIRLK